MAEHVARCQCGRIVVRARENPGAVVVCNCRACQRRTGSPFGAAGYWPQEMLEITGESRVWRRTADSGKAFETHFCPTCGTSVWWTLELKPGTVGVAYGCFDDPLPEPARVVWAEKRHDWVSFPPHWPVFERGRPER